MVIAYTKKSSTFANELVSELFSSSYNLLVISFSVINYVVSMRCPRASGDVSFFSFIAYKAAQGDSPVKVGLNVKSAQRKK